MVNSITKQNFGLIGINSFSVGIDAKNILRGERISKRYQANFGVSYTTQTIMLRVCPSSIYKISQRNGIRG